MLDEAGIRSLPKVVLHDHLDGGVRPATVLEIADEVGHELPVGGADRTAEGLALAMSVAMPRAVSKRSSGATQAEATFIRNSSGP